MQKISANGIDKYTFLMEVIKFLPCLHFSTVLMVGRSQDGWQLLICLKRLNGCFTQVKDEQQQHSE